MDYCDLSLFPQFRCISNAVVNTLNAFFLFFLYELHPPVSWITMAYFLWHYGNFPPDSNCPWKAECVRRHNGLHRGENASVKDNGRVCCIYRNFARVNLVNGSKRGRNTTHGAAELCERVFVSHFQSVWNIFVKIRCISLSQGRTWTSLLGGSVFPPLTEIQEHLKRNWGHFL